MQDWYNVGPTSSTRTFPRDGDPGDVFKATRSPLRDLPSCDNPHWIQPDAAHTYAIQGWGKNWVSSTILVMVNFGCFGSTGWRNVGRKLEEAFGCFKDWCKEHGKTTSLTEFSLKVFKVKSFLKLYIRTVFVGQGPGLGFRP